MEKCLAQDAIPRQAAKRSFKENRVAETNPTALRQKSQRAKPRRAEESIGERFGRLVVQSVCIGKYGARATCLCDCGVLKSNIRLNSLRNGDINSCSCLQPELCPHPTHGMSYSSEYGSWKHMRARCHDEKNHAYRHYGGRGIFVCEEWRHSFEAFFGHVGRKPTPEYTIERIDNNRGYEPGNVRWATQAEQCLNSRHNRLVTLNGKTMPVVSWARELGINPKTLHERIRLGMDGALEKPTRFRERNLTFNGQTLTIAG